VAYNSLLLERRRELHERTAQAIEALLHDQLEEHYSELAHHYSRSGNTAKAVDYLQRAGQQAVQRSAHAEAIDHLTTALELLKPLPDTLERAQQELALHITLGPALLTRGPGSPAVEQVYMRARELSQRVGEPRQLFRALWGLWRFHNNRAELQTARELGQQLLTLAQRVQDPALLLEAHHALWPTLFAAGELASAHGHLEQGMALYDPHQHRLHAFLYSGHDPGVCCRLHAAHVLWFLGYPDQGLQRIQEALALAQELAQPHSLF